MNGFVFQAKYLYPVFAEDVLHVGRSSWGGWARRTVSARR